MNRRFFAIILLLGVLALNMGAACQALCIGGHGAGHAKTELKTASNANAGHAGHCPLPAEKTAQPGKDCHHQENSAISCDCSHELSAAFDHDIKMEFFTGLTPSTQTAAFLPLEIPSASAKEAIPQDRPPRHIA